MQPAGGNVFAGRATLQLWEAREPGCGPKRKRLILVISVCFPVWGGGGWFRRSGLHRAGGGYAADGSWAGSQRPADRRVQSNE